MFNKINTLPSIACNRDRIRRLARAAKSYLSNRYALGMIAFIVAAFVANMSNVAFASDMPTLAAAITSYAKKSERFTIGNRGVQIARIGQKDVPDPYDGVVTIHRAIGGEVVLRLINPHTQMVKIERWFSNHGSYITAIRPDWTCENARSEPRHRQLPDPDHSSFTTYLGPYALVGRSLDIAHDRHSPLNIDGLHALLDYLLAQNIRLPTAIDRELEELYAFHQRNQAVDLSKSFFHDMGVPMPHFYFRDSMVNSFAPESARYMATLNAIDSRRPINDDNSAVFIPRSQIDEDRSKGLAFSPYTADILVYPYVNRKKTNIHWLLRGDAHRAEIHTLNDGIHRGLRIPASTAAAKVRDTQ